MKFRSKTIFIFLFSIIAIIDSINGYLIQVKNISSDVGLIYRAATILVLIYFISYKNIKNNIIKIYFIISYFGIVSLITAFNNSNALNRNIDILLKLIFPILTIEAFKNMNRNNLIDKDDIIKIFDINSILFPLSILIPKILGIGLNVYRDGSGFKGFYKSNNELNIILVILSIYCLDYLLNKSNKKKYLIYFFLNITSLILIGSKTSYISVALIIGTYTIKSLYKLKVKQIIGICITLILTLNIFSYYSEDIFKSLERQMYKMENYNAINFILSDRNELLKDAVSVLKSSEFTTNEIIFGMGPYKINNYIGSLKGRETREIEMDLFDTFFYYGIIGIIILILYYASYIKKSIIKFKKGELEFSVILSIIIMFGFSFFAGHVLYSALSGSFVGLLFCVVISSGGDYNA